MKIRTLLITGIVVFAVLLVIISGLTIVTNQQVEEIINQEDLANTIALEAGELGYLSNDYILYRESPQAERWTAKYTSIAEKISQLHPGTPETRAIRDSLAYDLERAKTVFNEISSSPIQAGNGGTDVIRLAWSRMAFQNEELVFDASRLADLLRDEADRLRETRLLLILMLTGTFVAFLLTSYFVFYRQTLKSIDTLQEGVRIIGSGNLDHVIRDDSDNEISELSRSFNQMTSDLKKGIASRADLEREVEGRKKAEQDLVERNVNLNALNEELTATQEELQQNVDELTRTEQELRTSREKYRNLFETMSEGFALHEIVCDDGGAPVDYRFLDINPAFEALTGLKRYDVIGKLVTEILPETEPVWIQRYGAVALTGVSDHFSSYSAPLDRYYEVTAYSPAPQQFAVVFSDVTEKRAALEALQASEKRLSRFYQSGLIGVIYWDMDGRITDANDKFLEITGYTREDLVSGRIDWIQITPPEYRHLDENSVRELQSTGANAEPFEKEYLRKDGSRVPVMIAGAMLDEGGSSGVAFVQDITVRKTALDLLKRNHENLNAAYEELTATREELQRNYDILAKREAQLKDALAEKEALLSEIHHRVKNNLASFISLLSLDGSLDKTPQGTAMKNDLQNRARSMSLIHDTLYKTHNYSTVDMQMYLSTLVQQVVGSYTSRHDVMYTVETHRHTLDLARATPVGLVVNELVTNALKYAFLKPDCRGQTPACRINVGLDLTDGKYVLTVQDNGAGFPQGYDPTTARTLGLKLVHFLVRHQLRGAIAFDSGDGLMVRVTFPEKV